MFVFLDTHMRHMCCTYYMHAITIQYIPIRAICAILKLHHTCFTASLPIWYVYTISLLNCHIPPGYVTQEWKLVHVNAINVNTTVVSFLVIHDDSFRVFLWNKFINNVIQLQKWPSNRNPGKSSNLKIWKNERISFLCIKWCRSWPVQTLLS